MKKLLPILLILIVVGLFVTSRPYESKAGVTQGYQAQACTTSSVSSVIVGNQLATTLVSTSSNRAYVTIQLPVSIGGVATNTVSVSFGNGAVATVGSGVALSTTTPRLEFGLNTLLPYTGTVSAITNTGSTTVLMTVCNY